MSSSIVIPPSVAERIAATKETCHTCKFCVQEDDGDRVCRRNPPTAWLIGEPLPPPHPPGRVGFSIKSAFPVIEPRVGNPGMAKKRWCGEWQAKLAS